LPLTLHVSRAGDDGTEAAFGTVGEPAKLVFGQASICVALGVGERRQHESVGHRRPVREHKGGEEGGHQVRSSHQIFGAMSCSYFLTHASAEVVTCAQSGT